MGEAPEWLVMSARVMSDGNFADRIAFEVTLAFATGAREWFSNARNGSEWPMDLGDAVAEALVGGSRGWN
jgi:hypothetical protein